MGYTTEFEGSFKLNKKLTQEQMNYLLAYSQTRHCQKIKPVITKVMEEAEIDFGVDGEFYALENEYGWGNDRNTKDVNNPPGNCPGLWCQWIPESPNTIAWDGGEKFYNYVEWLNFIIDNFLNKWGCEISGYVKYQGEDPDDHGFIVIKNNKVIKTKEYNYLE